jgi:hypothetical protein
MMTIFLITFGAMLLVILIMAIGYIFKGKTISGSCGGIGALGLEKECDCEEPCDKRKELLRKQAEEEAARLSQGQQRIAVDNQH